MKKLSLALIVALISLFLATTAFARHGGGYVVHGYVGGYNNNYNNSGYNRGYHNNRGYNNNQGYYHNDNGYNNGYYDNNAPRQPQQQQYRY
jgi:hypothetical protein